MSYFTYDETHKFTSKYSTQPNTPNRCGGAVVLISSVGNGLSEFPIPLIHAGCNTIQRQDYESTLNSHQHLPSPVKPRYLIRISDAG